MLRFLVLRYTDRFSYCFMYFCTFKYFEYVYRFFDGMIMSELHWKDLSGLSRNLS